MPEVAQLTSLGIISLVPPIFTVVMALWTKRAVESLFAGIAMCAWCIDYSANGLSHSLLYAIPNTFTTLAGHPTGTGQLGIGIIKNTSRAQIVIFVLLLGSFMTVLDYGGGAMDFARKATKYIKTQTSAFLISMAIGFSIFTSAFFCILVTATVMQPIFDRLKISREKLAYFCDSQSAPSKAWLPISGWIAYMVLLIEENIPSVGHGNGMSGFVHTMPYNFYCMFTPIFMFLLSIGVIKDFGPMKVAEHRVRVLGLLHKPGATPMIDESKKAVEASHKKDGHLLDMFVPLGSSVIFLLVYSLWNFAIQQMGVNLPKINMATDVALNVGFIIGLVVAFFQYTYKNRLMKPKEFLDHVVEGSKSSITGGIIIMMAFTLGDLLKAPPTEGLGTANYIVTIASPFIIPSLLPAMTFAIGAILSFCIGTSWGTWALMMPIVMPIALATGVNPFLTAAAVLSGGAFGDHCGPIADTNVLSSLASNVNHIEHVRTQVPYAIVVATFAMIAFVTAGIMGW